MNKVKCVKSKEWLGVASVLHICLGAVNWGSIALGISQNKLILIINLQKYTAADSNYFEIIKSND